MHRGAVLDGILVFLVHDGTSQGSIRGPEKPGALTVSSLSKFVETSPQPADFHATTSEISLLNRTIVLDTALHRLHRRPWSRSGGHSLQ